LKPEHLGSVQVSLKIENGAITATVQADVASVRQWLESQQDTLRTGLAEQGLRLERFVVERPVVDSEGDRQASPEDAQQREHRRRQHQRRMSQKDQSVFEVTV
jgi:flagellar hook-length control protein FliK